MAGPVAEGFSRLLLYQLVLVAATSAAFLVVTGWFPASSVWYGGLVAATNIGLLLRCKHRQSGRPTGSAQTTLVALYICALQRFIAVTVLFMLGMGVFKLHPLAVLAGFVAGQFLLLIPGTRKLIAN